MNFFSGVQMRITIGDGWLIREMGKLVARLLATAAPWVRIQTYLKKYKMGEKSKEVANTL